MSTESEARRADEVCVVFSTCPPGEAERLARFLVEGHHAACVNVVPSVTSFYTWQGTLCEEEESLLVIKAPRAGFERLRAALAAEHPYEVAEIVALPLAAGHPPYLAWVLEASGSPPRDAKATAE